MTVRFGVLGAGRIGKVHAAAIAANAGATLVAGKYELVFGAGAYFAAQGAALPDPPFLDRVVIAFGVADASQSYHVPLVLTPWSYSTYRGS